MYVRQLNRSLLVASQMTRTQPNGWEYSQMARTQPKGWDSAKWLGHVQFINRPGVAGAVLQTPSSLLKSPSDP